MIRQEEMKTERMLCEVDFETCIILTFVH